MVLTFGFYFQAELQEIFSRGFEYDGVFAISERYTLDKAPNPLLAIDGLGDVGCPLGVRDARALSDAGGTFSAAQVSFENPEWQKWIHRTVYTLLRRQLSIDTSLTLVLTKLVLSSPGPQTAGTSRSLPGGEVYVYLPSDFGGGQHTIRYNGRQEVFDPATSSKTSTTIVASLPGVEHTIAPLTSGFSLALVYEIRTSDWDNPVPASLSPGLGGSWPTQNVRKVFHDWKEWLAAGHGIGHAPPYLVYALTGRFDTSALSAGSLTGHDALLVQKVACVGHEFGFVCHLANLKQVRVVTKAIPEDEHDRDRLGQSDYEYDEYTDVVGRPKLSLEVEKVVDLSGAERNLPFFKPRCSDRWESDYLVYGDEVFCFTEEEREPHHTDHPYGGYEDYEMEFKTRPSTRAISSFGAADFGFTRHHGFKSRCELAQTHRLSPSPFRICDDAVLRHIVSALSVV
ncbi:hypothetical protein HMN09_00783700 [Mycena chlorophos]|uniref:Fe2OG dioxygenase domain-containing protein n=1 Tax=Mycena chlorophos TaxID=658473 RepID=A0A8H6WAI6_MYCCL|nr:hypothetical protein HMN09_00783700 [Mycena chlorophos]